ncbi:MAG: cupin domain-containing protein [Rhodospirillales bacterium]|nr:cupin domain-containing protein [Rhodospirillales bacterium]
MPHDGDDEDGGAGDTGHNRVFSLIGHNQISDEEHEAKFERWSKKRTFVRALEGTYGELVEQLFTQPRVYSTSDMEWKGGPHAYGKKVINPQSTQVAQSIECHVDVYSPGGHSQKHGHMNSAVFYILKGNGHDIHDGVRYDWQAGDAVVVENACVHEHCNTESDEEAVVLVFKAKPLFLFMHLLFQKMVKYPPKDAPKGYEDYTPPKEF